MFMVHIFDNYVIWETQVSFVCWIIYMFTNDDSLYHDVGVCDNAIFYMLIMELQG